MFDAGKTRMIGLPYGEKNYDDMLSRFHLVPERDGRTDRQTDRHICYINIARQYADKYEASRGLFATAELLVVTVTVMFSTFLNIVTWGMSRYLLASSDQLIFPRCCMHCWLVFLCPPQFNLVFNGSSQ